MFRRYTLDRAGVLPASRFLYCDLCAQLAPLNRYGLAGFSRALVNGVRTLLGAPRRSSGPKEWCAHC